MLKCNCCPTPSWCSSEDRCLNTPIVWKATHDNPQPITVGTPLAQCWHEWLMGKCTKCDVMYFEIVRPK